MLPVFVAEFIDMHKKRGARANNDNQAYECVDTAYIENCKQNEQSQQATAEIPYILCLESFKLNRLINSFVYCIDTCRHLFILHFDASAFFDPNLFLLFLFCIHTDNRSLFYCFYFLKSYFIIGSFLLLQFILYFLADLFFQ